MRPPATGREAGYAMVAAVASIAVFALIALMIVEAGRGTTVAATAEIERARAQAASEAGLAIALGQLLAGEAALDGRTRQFRYHDADIAVAVQDERGKVPLNALEEAEARRLFEVLGLTGERLDIAADSFLDWVDDDDDVRPHGAEIDDYAAEGIRPRNGPLRSVAETALIRGVGSDLADRMAAFTSVHFGNASFDPTRASISAIRVMEGDEDGAIDIINRQREIEGDRTALTIESRSALSGRPLTVIVEARLASGARSGLRQIVVLTDRAEQPYVLLERY